MSQVRISKESAPVEDQVAETAAAETTAAAAEQEESDDDDIPFFEDVPNPRLVREREEKAKRDAAEAKRKADEEAADAAHKAKLEEIEKRAKAIELMPEGEAKEAAEARLAEEAAAEDALEAKRHPPPPTKAVVIHDHETQQLKKTIGAPGSRPYGDGYEGTGARPCSHYNG